ncbi:histidine phosphatase family protein [Pokkaliibacter sp. CJK22405]|uniref:histidine phosphatase family protein n=1 Tax=Pokkaliibacter sp. CJK22405 TaxID=3384615 RepID=UPI0039855550
MAGLHLLLLRHGPTEWNGEKRIQGRTDIPLSEAGRDAQATRILPKRSQHLSWFSSPLIRTRQTAEALGLNVSIDPLLIEMDWGDWEGERLPELRARLGDEMQQMEDQGLDMRPPRGESPREVGQRLLAFCEQRLLEGFSDVGAVCHKGVIRSALALATGWPMLGKAPVRLDWEAAQLFHYENGQLRLQAANLGHEDDWR